MGYLTKYTLIEHNVPDDDFEDLLVALDKFDGRDLVDRAITDKWYDHEEPMLELSMDFPDCIFTLEGEGEEQGDKWRKRFLNGEMEEIRPDVVWPPFTLMPDDG